MATPVSPPSTPWWITCKHERRGVQTPNSGAVLESARISGTDSTQVIVTMSAPVTKLTRVACMRVLVP